MTRKLMRKSPAARSSNALFRVAALRVVQICMAAAVLLPGATASSWAPDDDDEWPGSVMTIVPKSRPVNGDPSDRPTPLLQSQWFPDAMASPCPQQPDDEDEWPGCARIVPVAAGSRPVGDPRRPTAMLPLPLLRSWDVRDATWTPRPRTTSSRPKPVARTTNGPKNRKHKTKTKMPKNKRNRNDGKEKMTVLKNKVIVKLEEGTPKMEDSPPSSPPTSTASSVVVMQETVPRYAANGRFVDVFGMVKSFEFQLAAAIVFALLVVIIAICRCWTLWTRRLTPFHVLP